jgi:hypothetical protein
MGCKPIGYRWVFALKKDASGKVVRYKARLVAKGYAQTFGQDYSETYAPVMDATTYRYLLAIAAQYGLEVETMDVVTAYLYGDLDRDLYMDVPEGYQEREQLMKDRPVIKLQKALYGLKQSERMWYNTSTFLGQQGFKDDDSSPCVLIRRDGTEFVFVAIFVDDLNIIGTKQAVAMAKQMLKEKFKMKDLGKLSHCIGLQVEHYDEGIFVHQSPYLQNILKKNCMESCNPIATPMEVRGDRELYGDRKEGEPILSSTIPYFSAIGELMWLANRTRPEMLLQSMFLLDILSNQQKDIRTV